MSSELYPTFEVSLTAPCTTCTTSGSMYLATSSASKGEVADRASGSFRTAVHPAAKAPTRGEKVRRTGKLNGEIIRTAPLGVGLMRRFMG